MSKQDNNFNVYEYAKAKLAKDVARYNDEEVAAFYGVFGGVKAVSDLKLKDPEAKTKGNSKSPISPNLPERKVTE